MPHCFIKHPDTVFKMEMLLLVLMLTCCSAIPQNLEGKMFTFPREGTSDFVRLTTSKQVFNAVTVCFRSFTDLTRAHSLFSMASPSTDNSILVYKSPSVLDLSIKGSNLVLRMQDYHLNTWNSFCATWDGASGVGQLWLNGKPSSRKFVSSGSNSGPFIIVLGQEQDAYGGGFDAGQSFAGMMTDVHMWDYTLSTCQIQNYMEAPNFPPGNVLNWKELEFRILGGVLIEDKQHLC